MYINRLTIVAGLAVFSMLSCDKDSEFLEQNESVVALANTKQANVTHDPTGDSNSPYMDVVHAKITEQKRGTLFFMMVLSGPIPEQPIESDLLWVFHLDTDPATAPGGFTMNISSGYVGSTVYL